MTFWYALWEGAFTAVAFFIVGSFIFWPLVLAFVFPGAWLFFLIVFVFWLATIGKVFDVGVIDKSLKRGKSIDGR